MEIWQSLIGVALLVWMFVVSSSSLAGLCGRAVPARFHRPSDPPTSAFLLRVQRVFAAFMSGVFLLPAALGVVQVVGWNLGFEKVQGGLDASTYIVVLVLLIGDVGWAIHLARLPKAR